MCAEILRGSFGLRTVHLLWSKTFLYYVSTPVLHFRQRIVVFRNAYALTNDVGFRKDFFWGEMMA